MSIFTKSSARFIAKEISSTTRYFDQLVQIHALKDEATDLLINQIECPRKSSTLTLDQCEDFSNSKSKAAVLLHGNLNHHFDIQELLMSLKTKLNRNSRVLALCYNPYFSFLFRLANFLRLRKVALPKTFVTETDLKNLCAISGYELVRLRAVVFFPFDLGIGRFFNLVLPIFPLLKKFSWVNLAVLRPVIAEKQKPSLSIVIPARNERGNIENAILRMPDLGTKLEIIFVEGNSNDQTWEEILRVQKKYENDKRFSIVSLKQTGKGKNDAVRVGFSKATGDVLTILDADLTMPPELLGRFFNAYCEGLADFINGSRLVYPMEGEAMRFLNHLGNVFFAKALSYVLESRIGDSLCGTKLVSRDNYRRIVAWRNDFGDFDPFGDFELLFPAASLGLGIIDIPIRYRARTYGTTNISRFRHGLMLLKMTLIGLFRLRSGRV